MNKSKGKASNVRRKIKQEEDNKVKDNAKHIADRYNVSIEDAEAYVKSQARRETIEAQRKKVAVGIIAFGKCVKTLIVEHVKKAEEHEKNKKSKGKKE